MKENSRIFKSTSSRTELVKYLRNKLKGKSSVREHVQLDSREHKLTPIQEIISIVLTCDYIPTNLIPYSVTNKFKHLQCTCINLETMTIH